MTRALSVFALHLAQTALVSVPFAIQAHCEARFCEDAHKPGEGLASGRAGKTGAKFIEKSSRISEMHLILFCVLSPGYW